MNLDDLEQYIEDNDTDFGDTIEFDDIQYPTELIYDEIEGYYEGIATYVKVWKIGYKYFKITHYYNSWDSGENSIEEVRISGYKQVPIFENIDEEKNI